MAAVRGVAGLEGAHISSWAPAVGWGPGCDCHPEHLRGLSVLPGHPHSMAPVFIPSHLSLSLLSFHPGNLRPSQLEGKGTLIQPLNVNRRMVRF